MDTEQGVQGRTLKAYSPNAKLVALQILCC